MFSPTFRVPGRSFPSQHIVADLRDEPRIFIGQLNGFLSKSSAYRSAVIEHHHNYYSKAFAR